MRPIPQLQILPEGFHLNFTPEPGGDPDPWLDLTAVAKPAFTLENLPGV